MSFDLERRRAWDTYWASGALHSCAGSFAGNYDGSIAAFWRETFATLQAGDRVLDVACGNGALAHLLLECQEDPLITCDGIDRAMPSPGWHAEMPPHEAARVRFHAGVAAEQMPFADGLFALVASQYGLEYTELGRSVPELRRVAAPAGRIALLTHHAGSRPVALANDELAHIDWLGSADGLLASVARIIPILERAGTPQGRAELARDPGAERERLRFNELQRELALRAEGASCPDVLYEVRDAVGALFALVPRSGPPAALAALERIRSQLAASRVRLQDLCRCALDAAGVSALGSLLGRTTRVTEIRESGHLMGWTLVGKRLANTG